MLVNHLWLTIMVNHLRFTMLVNHLVILFGEPMVILFHVVIHFYTLLMQWLTTILAFSEGL